MCLSSSETELSSPLKPCISLQKQMHVQLPLCDSNYSPEFKTHLRLMAAAKSSCLHSSRMLCMWCCRKLAFSLAFQSSFKSAPGQRVCCTKSTNELCWHSPQSTAQADDKSTPCLTPCGVGCQLLTVLKCHLYFEKVQWRL